MSLPTSGVDYLSKYGKLIVLDFIVIYSIVSILIALQ